MTFKRRAIQTLTSRNCRKT